MRVRRNKKFKTTYKALMSLLSLFIFSHEISGAENQRLRLLADSDIIQKLISPTLETKCDSLLVRLTGDPDSTQFSEIEKLEVKDAAKLKIGDKELTSIIVGCREFGELILIDSSNESSKITRINISIPGKHATLGEIQDINGDSIQDLSIYFSAGAHGMYSSFLSVYDDSIKFIPIEGEGTKFFAFTGGIKTLDLDNDSIMEVRIGPDLSKPENTQFEIYKWTGTEYSKVEPK